MADNPLFPNDKQAGSDFAASYLLSKKSTTVSPEGSAAADVIRDKLDKIYANEPDAEEELEEIAVVKPDSKHQKFMQQLSSSGKSLAEIQTEWHHYYVTL